MSSDYDSSVNAPERMGNALHTAILPASLIDSAELLDLSRKCDSHPWSEENLLAELAGEFAFHFLLRSLPENLLCSAILNRLVFDEVTIMKVYTRPEFRRQGLARRLLIHTFDEAKKRGAKTAFLEVGAGNKPAIALYESLGFAAESIRRGYYDSGEDAAVMKKRL